MGVIFSLCAFRALAQVTIIESPDNDRATVYKMTVSPAAEPQPALKYRFLTPPVDRIHANAATFYYKAMVFEGPDMWFPKQEVAEKIYEWEQAPLEKLPLKEIAENVLHYRDQTAWQPLHDAARCDYCNWGDPIRESGAVTLLPQAQKMRAVARGIALRARTEIATGQFANAIDTLQLGYALSRNMGHGCCIVESLIGIAIQGLLNEQALTLMAADNSPNLYWALADLAAQPVDLRQAMSYETHLWEFTIHELADLDNRTLSNEDAVVLAEKVWNTVGDMRAGRRDNTRLGQAAMLLWTMEGYSESKDYLLHHGYEASRLDAMPLVQVVLLYRWQQYVQLRDDYFKWILLPDDEMRNAIKQGQDRVDVLISEGVGAPFAEALPAIRASIYANWRSQRHINLIQLIEALRMYAAEHGRWPEKLEDITAVPAPMDPWSQKPFEYSVKDGVAILEAPRSPKAPWPITEDQRYELTLRAPGKALESSKQEK
jgi:hypothetical protein